MDATPWPVGRARSGQTALVAALLAVAALAWVLTVRRMSGMDEGPGTDPGALGFYLTAWVAMMAAMMLPSAAPMVVAHSLVQRRKRELGREREAGESAAFAAGYLVAWAAFGVAAYVLFELLRSLDIGALAWDRGGRWAAAGAIGLAAVYQLTPLKDACLSRCRSPLAFVVGHWRPGRWGALVMGVEHGAWCIGCCWALMVALFALGLMSITWMAVVAALVAFEKLLPWRRPAELIVAVVLCILAIAVAAAPEDVPGLTVPGHSGSGPGMSPGMSMGG